VTAARPAILLGLTPLAERAVEPLLFGDGAAVELAGSAAEADELERLADGSAAVAALVSPQLSGITAGHCARVRAAGLRLIGLALDDHERDALDALGVEVVIGDDATAEELAEAAREQRPAPAPRTRPQPRATGDRRALVAVIGSKGAPGASEVAASLASLVSDQWPALLLELDALGGDLDVRVAADPDEGSVLGLVRAVAAHRDEELRGLLERWIVGADGWPAMLLGAPAESLTELGRAGATARALDAVAQLWPAVIVDVGFALAVGDDPAAARVHREAVVSADAVVLVIGAREAQLRYGVAQLDRLLDDLNVPRERLRVVVNGIGASGAPERRVVEQTVNGALAERRLAADAWVAWDARGLRRAQRLGLPIARAHPRGRYARALRQVVADLFLPAATEPLPRARKQPLSGAAATPPAAATPATGKPATTREEVALPWRPST
jgi:Flp pilus assembly CpaE family ATPase